VAYVSNTGSDTVTVIDTVSNTEAATFNVGDTPNALAASPNGQNLYVFTTGGMVQTIDTTSGAVVASIASGGGALGDIAVKNHGMRLHVASGPLAVIDAATHTMLNSDLTGCERVVISPNESRAYMRRMLSIFGGDLAVVDTATGNVIASIDVGVPDELAIASDGSRVYLGHAASWINTGYGAGFLPGRAAGVIDTIAHRWATSIDLGAAKSNWSQQNTIKHEQRHRAQRRHQCHRGQPRCRRRPAYTRLPHV
jgi:YVTN family beta-propeller protein